MANDLPRRHRRWTDGVIDDLRFATRILFKHRFSTTLTLLILAVGLGVNTALFMVTNAWLITPYPYPSPDRLVLLEARHVSGNAGAHYRDVLDWRDRNHVFEEIAIFSRSSRVLTAGAEPQRVVCQVSTAGALRVLGIGPLAGRFFTAEEDAPGGAAVALVTELAWKTRFNRRPDIIGATATLDGRPHTIVGVMPDRAALPQRVPPEFWLPLRANAAAPHGGQQYYELMARLKPGVTLEAARANMAAVATALEREDPASYQGWRVGVTPAQETIRARNATAIAVLSALSGCVLLLVLANVAGILLVRSASRAKEFAIRAALGAGRWRLVRQLLIESVIVGVLAGGLGLLVAGQTLRVAETILPNRGLATLPALDWRILVFTASMSLGAAILFGVWPALRAAAVNLATALKSGGFASGGTPRMRGLSTLAVVELALAMALLVSGGLLVKDLASLLHVETGVQTQDVTTFLLRPAVSRYGSDEAKAALAPRVVELLRAIPGVEAAAAVGELPMGGDKTGVRFDVGTGLPATTAPSARGILNASSPGYFETLGIPLHRGRDFDERDRLGTEAVAIVSDSLVRRHIAGRDPIGERVRMYGRSYTIVGVVGSVRHDGPRYEVDPEIYLPLAQSPRLPISVVVRSAGDRAHVLAAVRQRVGELDAQLPIERVRTMEEVMRGSLAQSRLSAQLMAGFALFGLALALTGLYGVIAHATEQRTREIAIRIAVGATAGDVLRPMLRRGGALALVALAIGLPAALALSRVLKTALVLTSPYDPLVLSGVPAVIVAAAVAATYVPARRATRVQPIRALSSE